MIVPYVLDYLKQQTNMATLVNTGGAEMLRKELASKLIEGDTLICDVVATANEAVGIIDIARLIAEGTLTPGSGVQLREMSLSLPKTNEEEITFSFEIRVVVS